MAVAEHYHAGAAAYWSKGADGIYLPWFNWPIKAPDRHILSEINDPGLLAQKTKHYVVYGHNATAASCGYTAQLPVHLVSGTDAPGQEVSLFIADDPDRADATLRGRLRFTTVHDSLTVSLNGHPLPNETCRRESHGYTPTEAPLPGISSAAYTWLEYPVPRGTLQKGANEVGVAIHARPPNLQGQVVLGRLDLIVTYPGA